MINQVSKYRNGIRFGIITGVLYTVLLFVRYRFFAVNPVSFGLFAAISYILILLLYLFTGISRKKELGGYAEMKEIFQSIFIAILIAEGAYLIFNFIYLKYADPSFWEKFRTTSLSYLEKMKLPRDQIDQQMKAYQNVDDQMRPLGLLMGYGYGVIIDSIFGFIIAYILRKKNPSFQEIK
jgi:hypothetical protein